MTTFKKEDYSKFNLTESKLVFKKIYNQKRGSYKKKYFMFTELESNNEILINAETQLMTYVPIIDNIELFIIGYDKYGTPYYIIKGDEMWFKYKGNSICYKNGIVFKNYSYPDGDIMNNGKDDNIDTKNNILKTEPNLLNEGGIPSHLFGVNPRNIKGHNWWERERQKAFVSTNYHCLACGVHKSEAKYRQWLEGHETFEYDTEKFIMTFSKIVPLCYACHQFVHIGRTSMYSNEERIKEILLHGFKILKEANFLKVNSSAIQIAQINNVTTLGLKPITEVETLDKEERQKSRKEYRERYKTEDGWKLSFEGQIYPGKSNEQLKEEYSS